MADHLRTRASRTLAQHAASGSATGKARRPAHPIRDISRALTDLEIFIAEHLPWLVDEYFSPPVSPNSKAELLEQLAEVFCVEKSSVVKLRRRGKLFSLIDVAYVCVVTGRNRHDAGEQLRKSPKHRPLEIRRGDLLSLIDVAA